MPSSAVRTFSDPDEYAAAIRNSRAEMTVTKPGHFAAKLIQIELHRLWMQRFSETLPRIAHSAHMGRAVVTFCAPSGPNLLWRGTEMRPTNLVRHSERESGFQHSRGSASFAAMSLPVEDIASLGEAVGDLDLTPPKEALIHTPAPHAMARLQRLHTAAGDLAENAPEIIANADAAHGLEQALIEAVVACLAHGEGRKPSLAQGQHATVMRRFFRMVEENPEQPLFIPEICNTIGVSERTLRMCCQEHLGMSPKRYLLLRRMGLARRALLEGTPDTTSVTAIGTGYGFWELGRFAVEYQALFGEAPSATLRQ